MENQIKTLIEIIENTKFNKIEKNNDHIKLEDYLDITKDSKVKNLDYKFYSLFGYDDDDEEIFELDYEFMINNIY